MVAWFIAALASAALSATVGWKPRPLLVWNMSESSPLGLYQVRPARDLRPGAMVVAWLPAGMRGLAAARHYLPANIPLVKRVGAGAGDRVCGAGERIYINGRLAAVRRQRDSAGRAMPWWEGCHRLGIGEVFLLSSRGSSSFDGRYAGITRAKLIMGEASLIWPR
jgi:conjugative transfer signal peptidase TraF